jgi:hypothetical protein
MELASFAATASNILGGSATYIPYFNTNTTLANSAMYQIGSASIAINETNITTANPEALYVFQTHPTSFNAITGKGNLNNYIQLNIQNTNQGVDASSDVVATANNGNEESMYINMGINSENFSGPLGNANDAYLYSVANNLHIGSAATGSQHLGLFVGGLDVDENNKVTLRSNNLHELTGSLDVSGSLVVRYGITGNLNGTASYATLAEYALDAGLLDGYDSAAFLLTSSYNNFTASYLIDSASFSSSISSLGGSYLISSASFDTRILNNSSSIGALSSSYLNSSASFDIRILNNSSSINTLSGLYLASSASFDTRILNNSSSINILSGSYLDSSASFDTRILNNSSSIGALSSSYLNSSASFDTRILNNSSSISILSSSYLNDSSSFNNRIEIISSSYAITGSNIFKGDQTITGSLFQLGSLIQAGNTTLTGSLNVSGSTIQIGDNTLIGNTVLSGSIQVSGSQTFVGTHTLTGSFLVSGSTTQIGNNTLFGDTLLTGNITISGSYPVGSYSSSVNIIGDTSMTGYLKFNPQSTNIDTTVSASYIFVSGSTNDLYFSQNGNGYSNVTRLRWIEGNLYTGLLNGGRITANTGSTTFNLNSGSGIVVDLNVSLADNPYPTITYVNWNNFTNVPLTYLTSSIQSYIGIDSAGNITQQNIAFSNGTYNEIITIGSVLHQNKATVNATITYPNVAYGYKQRTYDFIKAFGPLKLSGLTIIPSGSLGLEVGSGTAFADGRNYQVDPNNPSYITDPGTTVSKIFRYYQSGSEFVQDTNNGLGYTALDPANYNPGGLGVLTPVPGTGTNREWSIQRVFWYPNSATKGIVVYYGSSTYANEIDAAANINYEQFIEVENTKQNAVYLGAIVIRYNGDFTTPGSYKLLPGGIFRNVGGSGGGGEITSLLLSQLGDVLISGPQDGQPLVYNSTDGKWENRTFISASISGNAATATSASFATTSSYVLNAVSSSFATNATSASYALNADLLDGRDSNTFAGTGSNQFNGSQTITGSLTVTGQITAQTLNVQQVTSSIVFSSGSNIFGSNLSNTQQFTGSVSVTGSLSINDSLVILTNQTSSMSVLSASYANNSTSASYALNATTASYALEATSASYAFNSTSASQSENSNTANSSSYALNSTSASYALNSISASQSNNTNTAISASQANNANTAISASYALNATTASYALEATSASYAFNSTSASYALTASYAMNGGGGGISAITMADEGVLQGTASYFDFVGEGVIVTVSNNTASINIPANIITGSTSFLDQTIPATTWSFTHNLNSKYVNFEVYNSSDFVIIPAGIKVVDQNNAEIYFSSNTTGKAVAQFSGIDGMSNALSASYATYALSSSYAETSVSASYAATSSHASNFTIDSTLNFSGTLTDYASVNSSVAGSNNLFTQPTASYTSAFFKYTVSNGGNARSGEIMAIWNGTTVEFTDNSTADIGTTTPVTSSVAIVGGDLQFNMQTNTSGWRIKSIGTFI